MQLGMSRFKQMQRANVDTCWHKGHKSEGHEQALVGAKGTSGIKQIH